MRESRTYGSVRGALSNERPYREQVPLQLRYPILQYMALHSNGAESYGKASISQFTNLPDVHCICL